MTNVRLGFVDTKMAKARVRPFMMTADAAATLVMRALERRPIRVTRPWRMAVLLWVLRAVAAWRIQLGYAALEKFRGTR